MVRRGGWLQHWLLPLQGRSSSFLCCLAAPSSIIIKLKLTPPAKKRSAASTARHAGTEDARHYLKEGWMCGVGVAGARWREREVKQRGGSSEERGGGEAKKQARGLTFTPRKCHCFSVSFPATWTCTTSVLSSHSSPNASPRFTGPPSLFFHSHHPPPTATDLPTLPQATNQKASAPMAKTGNKATRKLAKKGLLDFTSRGMCGWG